MAFWTALRLRVTTSRKSGRSCRRAPDAADYARSRAAVGHLVDSFAALGRPLSPGGGAPAQGNACAQQVAMPVRLLCQEPVVGVPLELFVPKSMGVRSPRTFGRSPSLDALEGAFLAGID
eukprot:COSAG05_NODE_10750_length_548_cov_1.022272_1_plen_119_part_10